MIETKNIKPKGVRVFSWVVLVGGLTALGLASSSLPRVVEEEILKDTGRRSNENPVPPRGKLGQDLFLAIDHRDLAGVKALLKQGADPNSLNGLELRPLYLAAASYQMDVMAELIKAGAKPDVKGTYGSPLAFAASSGNMAGASILLNQGADPNTIRSDGISVLMLAANAGNPALVGELIKRKADVRTKDDGGETALSFAARAGHVEVGKQLVDAGADIENKDVDGLTPLMAASMSGHAEFVKLLLSSGAKPNVKDAHGRTALVLAARYGDFPEVVKALVAGGANPAAKDSDGRIAAQVASSRGFSKCASVLGGSTPVPALRTASESVKLSLGRLQASMQTFTESATCISCHHEGLGRIATGEAQDRGFKIDKGVKTVQTGRLQGMVGAMKPLHQNVIAHPENMKNIPMVEMNEIGTTYTWLLAGMYANHQPANEANGAMAMILARQQAPDGSWTFSVPRGPMQSSFFTFTALSIKALKEYGPKSHSKEIAERIGKAKAWLLHAEAKSNEDRASKLLGLKWAGAGQDAIKAAVKQIVSDQRQDGGWSIAPNGYSDAYATGQALYALHVGGKMNATNPVYKRGSKFLIRTQDSDGSWFVPKRTSPNNNYFDAGFPHGESQYASFNATCWATLALLESAKPTVK